jgi:hypothetical protein
MNSLKSLVFLLAFTPAIATANSNDYPTLDTVGFVLTCMESNGGISRETLYTCTCRIDHIAANLPFTVYEEAEIWERYRGHTGERGALFRSDIMPDKDNAVSQLRRAQFEAKQACPLTKVSPDSQADRIEDYRGGR